MPDFTAGLGAGIVAATVWILPLLLAITLHEASHAFAAKALGDDTAARLGRVSLNPFKHIDLFGTVLLPAVLLITRAPVIFGWAKPVPVAFGRLRQPRRDMALVAAAGPACNLVLALASALAFHLIALVPEGEGRDWVAQNLFNSVLVNLVLCIFNLLPLPPLDGGRIMVAALPRPLGLLLARVERFALLILLAVVFVVPMLARPLGLVIEPFRWLVGAPVEYLLPLIFAFVGLGPA